MKKMILPFILSLVMAFGALVSTQALSSKSSGGFSGPGPSIVSATAAAKLKDSTRVALKGNIIQHLGDDQYLFKDSSGTIQLDIDDHIWKGVIVAPTDTVIIYGKIDKDFSSVEVDVKKIEKQ